MQPLSVVLASSNSKAASQLAASLNSHFRIVSVARSLDEVRHAIPQHRAQLAIVDLELASVDEVERLVRDFSRTTVVCTHRIPDDEMWASVLAAGAIDCCASDDPASILQTVIRNVNFAYTSAA